MARVVCSCCGMAPEQGWVNLLCHRDIVICYQCLDWLNTRRYRQVAAAGGGAAVTGVEPVFSVADVGRAVDHYQRLGFRTSYHDESYAFAHRDGLTIHLAGTGHAAAAADSRDPAAASGAGDPAALGIGDPAVPGGIGEPAAAGGSVLYMHVDDADQLAGEWRKAGVAVTGPEDQDYGKREGFHVDPDGNKLRFGAPLHHPET